MRNIKHNNSNKILSWIAAFALLTNLSLLPACKTMDNTQKGGAIGAGAGGAIGGVIGNKAGNTAVGAIIGATVGGAAGALIGRQMDKQAEELEEDLEGAEVTRVGEGIKITFDSGLLFDYDSYALRDNTKENLQEMAETLKKYEDTNILIEGHTDSTGSDDYNEELSEDRAESVSEYLLSLGVSPDRLTTMGYGEEQPVTDNDTAEGRQENRRVEVAIYANEEMKEAAEEGRLGE
ncbi:outer membrane protein OmpA-like peptidoglycan-associated protein [Catalinimonas alkaloidigena]|uniref:OmpA family protein n=1 Tax=Catalinimonas alkaloidigena TaxID=1075417 RepID=UPI0024054C78|nr:OmpA family protein [Catalinimonas alkaloidigena]MDF9798257.1 outer membrane protein OmpA-like peptidoglycan-associated protein [Catalinimonas alkaloidigena]